jgi:quercetin dioxygenase-like cupin family protein
MAGLESKRFESPDETRPFVDKGYVQVVKVGEATVLRGVFEPGWRWSTHVKPLAKTDSCQAMHAGHVISGRMQVVMDDGTATELGPGDVVSIAPGHDAWTVGDEPCVMLDFGPSVGQYARRS